MSAKKDGMNPETFMKKVFEFVDFYMGREIYKFTECSKGCAYCCRLPVSTSALEAYYLYGVTSNRDDIEFVNLEPSSPRTDNSDHEYCPFLNQQTGTCTVYERRPLNCRTFASLDGWKECIDPFNEHKMHAWSSNEMLKVIRQNINMISQQNGKVVDADIRDWFKAK